VEVGVTFRETVMRILEARNPRHETPPGYRRAAVLLPLYETPAGPWLVLTKRTDRVPTHKGQISFPGGGFHETDGDLLTTALRESAEEIGLRAQDVAVAGVLDDAATAASAHVVRPFVGFIPHPYPFRLDTFEIETLIHLPLGPLLAENRFREEIWDQGGHPHPVFFYDHGGQTIWGLTARILKQFVEIIRASPQHGGQAG
jgi:8-oxo-dGTP pyrophosphatase MutT (NUDIX family)